MNAKLADFSRKTVLLLDADPEHSLFMFEELQSRGFTVLQAECVSDALDLIETNSIGLVIIDLELSRAEKASLFEQIKLKGSISVLWLIAPSLMSREEAYAAGANAILSKPIEPELLIKRIQEILVPTPSRWKYSATKEADATLEASLEGIDLGRGGISVNVPKASGASQMFEGQRIRLSLEVNETQKWILRGTGILRYIKMDKKSQEPKAWGIEFESLEDASLERVLNEINKKKPLAFIPTLN